MGTRYYWGLIDWGLIRLETVEFLPQKEAIKLLFKLETMRKYPPNGNSREIGHSRINYFLKEALLDFSGVARKNQR